MALLFAVVGHTTMTKTRVLAVFDGAVGMARLAYRGGGQVFFVDEQLLSAPPYRMSLFELAGLSGESIEYAVADYAVGAAPPDPAQMLATGARRIRLQRPLDQPPRIALVSCNDIDNHAFPKEQRGAMWRRLKQLVDAGEVDLLIHAGDQIYGDGDPLGWTPAEGRTAAYRRHYVNTWSHPDVASVLASCPNVMMWDDHEIFDGYGSNDNDGTDAAQTRYRSAEQAFREFQVPLNPADNLGETGFGWVGQYGDIAVLALDGRSQRSWARGTILGKDQLDAVELKLAQLAALNLRHLFVVVGTPVVYIPILAAEKLATLAHAEGSDDLRDGWTASRNREDCRALLMRLFTFAGRSPRTMVTFLGGDIHVGSLGQIEARVPFAGQSGLRLYQVTSSGIARPAPSGLAAFFVSLLANGATQDLFNRDLVGMLNRINGSDHAYCLTHRNFAVLDPSDGTGKNWNAHGNLTVTFHTELPGHPILRQQLLGRG